MNEDISLIKRYGIIKLIYDKTKEYKTSYITIDDSVSKMDLKYLEDKGFINITMETCGGVVTGIQVRAPLIEYVENFEEYCEP